MENKKILAGLGLFFCCITLNGAMGPVVRWDTSTYLTTVREQLNTELTAELARLFAGYSGKDRAFSTNVITQVSDMVREIVAALGEGNEDQDLFTDIEFKEKLELFKFHMAQVSVQLAEGARQKTSFHKRPENNQIEVGRCLDELKKVKNELLARVKYVQGKPSPEQQRRASVMQQQQAREAVLKKFREFVQEMRKDPKMRTGSVDELYKAADVIDNTRNGHFTDEQTRTFIGYRDLIAREKSLHDAKERLLRGDGSVILEVPFEGKPGDVVYFEHHPEKTVLLKKNLPEGGVFHAW